MKQLLSVTVCGLLQLDVKADPTDTSDVLDATYHKLKDFNVDLDACELDYQPQIFAEGLDKSDITWTRIDEDED